MHVLQSSYPEYACNICILYIYSIHSIGVRHMEDFCEKQSLPFYL